MKFVINPLGASKVQAVVLQHSRVRWSIRMKTTSLLVKSAAIAAVSMMALPSVSNAATLNADISAVVATPMAVTQTTAMAFGTVAVVPGADNLAWGNITLDADTGAVTDPVAEANGANIIYLTGAAPGVVNVYVGAALAVAITVTVPLTATLVDAGAGDDLDVSAITVGTPTAGAGVTGDCSGGCNVTSAATGNFTFPIGAKVTMAVGNGTYPNDTYAGQYTITTIYQ